ncbi:hypothetical protein QTO34_018633 [Cnephaeus nilssonii]|uniref:Uncharacterized protein n=1 Tax=Cnephaeus nilssonii TaxID=3371016 RepID=A0AA40HZ72_CNENI|nr:hypothetical protein QTO34_018633 [Eptesicus nilssonii]
MVAEQRIFSNHQRLAPMTVTLYNTEQDGSDSPRSSLNNSLSDQSLASVNLNSVGSVHSYTPETQGAGLRVAGVADWASRTLSSWRHWHRELSVCAMAAGGFRKAWGTGGQPAGSPVIKGQSGGPGRLCAPAQGLSKASAAPEAFGRPGGPGRLSAPVQGLSKASAAPEAFGRPGAPVDSRPGPPRSKAKAGDPAGCLLWRKAFRKPPQRRRLSEGLGHPRTASPLVHQDQGEVEKLWGAIWAGTRRRQRVQAAALVSAAGASTRWDCGISEQKIFSNHQRLAPMTATSLGLAPLLICSTILPWLTLTMFRAHTLVVTNHPEPVSQSLTPQQQPQYNLPERDKQLLFSEYNFEDLSASFRSLYKSVFEQSLSQQGLMNIPSESSQQSHTSCSYQHSPSSTVSSHPHGNQSNLSNSHGIIRLHKSHCLTPRYTHNRLHIHPIDHMVYHSIRSVPSIQHRTHNNTASSSPLIPSTPLHNNTASSSLLIPSTPLHINTCSIIRTISIRQAQCMI